MADSEEHGRTGLAVVKTLCEWHNELVTKFCFALKSNFPTSSSPPTSSNGDNLGLIRTIHVSQIAPAHIYSCDIRAELLPWLGSLRRQEYRRTGQISELQLEHFRYLQEKLLLQQAHQSWPLINYESFSTVQYVPAFSQAQPSHLLLYQTKELSRGSFSYAFFVFKKQCSPLTTRIFCARCAK